MEFTDPYKQFRTHLVVAIIVVIVVAAFAILGMIGLSKEVSDRQIRDYNAKVGAGYTLVIDGRKTSAVVEAEYALKHYNLRVDDANMLIYMSIKEKSFARDLLQVYSDGNTPYTEEVGEAP